MNLIQHPLTQFSIKALIVVLVSAVALRLVGPLPLSVNTKTVDKDSTFFVSGDASVFVSPDIANVTASIESINSKAVQAQKASNEIINKVAEELKKLGVGEDDIKTTSYNIYPVYTADGKRIDSYRSAVSIKITVKDIEKVNDVIDTAVANGANQISSVTFDVEDKEAALNEARKSAIQKAKDKAGKISSEAGIKLGRVLNVSEYYPLETPLYAIDGKAGMGGGGGATEVQPGQTEIKVNVTLSYETL